MGRKSKLCVLSVSGIFFGLAIYFFDLDWHPIIRNYIPDFFWSFSLTCALLVTLHADKNLYRPLILSGFVGIVYELLQGLSIVPGTYDAIDILAYLIGVLAAFLVQIKMMEIKT